MGIINDTAWGAGSISEPDASPQRVKVTGDTTVAQANSAIASVNKLLARHIEEKRSQASHFTPDGLSAEIGHSPTLPQRGLWTNTRTSSTSASPRPRPAPSRSAVGSRPSTTRQAN